MRPAARCQVSSRKVLAAVLSRYGVPQDKFAEVRGRARAGALRRSPHGRAQAFATGGVWCVISGTQGPSPHERMSSQPPPHSRWPQVCVIVDKMEKLPREQVEAQLGALGVAPQTIDGAPGPCLHHAGTHVFAASHRTAVPLCAWAVFAQPAERVPRQPPPQASWAHWRCAPWTSCRCAGPCPIREVNEGCFSCADARTAPCLSLPALPPPPTPKTLLGDSASEVLSDLRRLWALAEGYGYSDWLVFDASVVRGLAYYTGDYFF